MNRQTVARLISISAFLVVLSLACQAGPLGRFFATPTPTPTDTPTPTLTPTSTATPTPTNTPTPLPTGIKFEELADHATLVTDYDNRYQLILPQGWVVIFSSYLDSSSQEDPQVASMIEIYKANPDLFRLMGINANPKYLRGRFPTFLNIMAFSEPLLGTMPMAMVTAMLEDAVLKDATIIAWDTKINPYGVEIGINDAFQTMETTSGSKVDVQTKLISFQSNKKLILIQIVTPKEFGKEVLPPMEKIIDSIKLDKP